MKLKVYDPQKNRNVTIGELIGDTFYKEVHSKKHFMFKLNGYGITESAFRKLRIKDVKHMLILETDTGVKLQSTLDDWSLKGIVKDFGAGEQRFLNIKYMSSPKDTQRSLV